MEFKGTKGEWTLPHFADDNIECSCKYILNEMYAGCIATVEYGEENPQLQEAKYNALLISKSYQMLHMLQYVSDKLNGNGFPTLQFEIDMLIKEATELK